MPKRSKRPRKPGRRTRRRGIDWKGARVRYERDGATFKDIAEELGVRRETVSKHAKAEGWIALGTALVETRDARREEFYRLFVQQDAEAMRDNLEKKVQASALILDFFLDEAGKLREQGNAALADRILAAGQIALGLRRLQIVDDGVVKALTGDGGWRPSEGDGGRAPADADARIREALRRLEAG